MDFILNIFSYILPILGAIMLLVFVHELGHFLFAKLFKMRVERFSVGFPPKIVGKRIGETEYVLGATPLGGYVKIAGMVDESMDTEFAGRPPEPWEFRAKPVWQRIVVIVAGVVFNMILAAVVFMMLKGVYGERYVPPLGEVMVADSSLAYQMGLRTGDRILEVNGAPPARFAGLRGLQEALLAERLQITVLRDGQRLTFEGPEDIMTQLSRARGNFGIAFDPPVVGDLVPGAPAERIGLRPGDRILAIDGHPIRFWHEMTERIQQSEGQPLTLRWARPDSLEGVIPPGLQAVGSSEYGRVYEASVTPDERGGRYVLGVYQLTRSVDYGFGEAVVAGLEATWLNTRIIVTSLKRIVFGSESLRENLGGPIQVAVLTREAAADGAYSFWNIVAVLSITLAIINILPIPALDGGHLVFLLYEAVARREPSLKVRMVTQQIGMALLLGLMAFLIFNDILRL
ncbi:RIP metalloprotease RseP [Rhodocaloribacter litoris]|uniref:RIP metalloprotease RseP n=1 Tax=Rhodocaloribacter litoris TaxID=2558931 RepID=UPI001424080C|nr:RIP metalloprotease RseP [Rhodocaloribacter litoris]QXD16302.1 RIP metalloprotease RseP [Rhodocaloribacter litoris]